MSNPEILRAGDITFDDFYFLVTGTKDNYIYGDWMGHSREFDPIMCDYKDFKDDIFITNIFREES